MDQKVIVQVENFTVKEGKGEKGVIITGLALPFGKRSRNGLVYNPKSVKEVAGTLENAPMLFNHNPDRPIGHVNKTWCTDEGMFYEGDIDPNETEIVHKVHRGDIPHVSIQALVEPVRESTTEGEVSVKTFLELSPCTIPGFPDTDINGVEVVTLESFKRDLSHVKETDKPPVSEDDTVKEPFAGYRDFKDCVAKNKDKDDPEAYCGSIKAKAEIKDLKGKIGELENYINTTKSIQDEDTMDEKELKELKEDIKKSILEELEKSKPEPEKEQDEPGMEDKLTAVINELATIKQRLDALEGGSEEGEEGDEDDEDDEDKKKKMPPKEKLEPKAENSRQSGEGFVKEHKGDVTTEDLKKILTNKENLEV